MAWIWRGLTLRVPMVGKDYDGCSAETAHLAKTAKLHCNARLRPTTAAQLADGAVFGRQGPTSSRSITLDELHPSCVRATV